MKKLKDKFFSGFFSQTAKDTYLIFTSNISSAFLAFLYSIFLARNFDPARFGIFSSILAFSLLVADVSEMGVGSSLSRFLPPYYSRNKESEAESFIKTSFLFIVKIALVVSFMSIFSSSLLSQVLLKTGEYAYLYQISGFFIFGVIFLSFINYVLSAQKKFAPVALLSFLSTFIKLLFVVLFSLFNKLDLFFAVFIFAFSAYPVILLSSKLLSFGFLKQKEKKGNLKKLLSFSAYLALSRLFSAIAGRLDILMLVPFASAYEGGIYSGAYKIASIYILLSGSFGMVIAPRLSGFPMRSQALAYLKKVILATIGILFSLLAVFFVSDPLVIFVLGSQYYQSVPVFRLLLVPMAFFVMTIPPVNYLIYSLKKPQISTLNTVIQLLIISSLNYLLIPRFGSYGAVFSLGVAYFITFILASGFACYFHHKTK